MRMDKELSYIDMLSLLNEKIESDIIPDEDKKKIQKAVQQLQELLWKYSY